MLWCRTCRRDISEDEIHDGKHDTVVKSAVDFNKEWDKEIERHQGTKHDQGKLPWHLLPYDVIEEVVAVLQHGAVKYGERNWEKGFDWSRLFSASQRHLKSFWQDKENDDLETGLSHLAHALCMIMFLLAHKRRGLGKDDRP